MVKPVNIVNLYIEVDTGTLYADVGLTDLQEVGFVLSSGIVVDGALVHGSLIGLDADDHPGYVLVDGSRPFSDNVSTLAPVPTAGSHLTRKDYVDSAVTSGTAGVSSLNTLLGNLTLVGTEGIGITSGGTTITISGTSDEIAKALVGSDGITVVSGVDTDSIIGFRTEFLNASGTLVNKSGDTMSGILDMGDNALTNVNYIDFDLVNGVAQSEGRAVWDADTGGLNVGMVGSEVNLQVGQESLFLAENNSGIAINKGQPVHVTGGSGDKPTIALSDADDVFHSETSGVATEDIAVGAEGYVTTRGLVKGNASQPFDTSTWGSGQRLFVSNTPGVLTSTPSALGARIIFVGIVIVADAQDGSLWVYPLNAFYLHELSGQAISSPQEDELLQYNSTISSWVNIGVDGVLSGHIADASAHHSRYTRNENEAIIGGTNVTVVSGANTITISSTAGGGGDADALAGIDGITVISGVPTAGTTTVSGFRDEFLSASGTLVNKTGDTMTGALKLPYGSVSAPSLTFADDPDTGLFRSASNDILVAVAGGAAIASFVNVGTLENLRVFRPIHVDNGSVTKPRYAFNTDTNTGAWLPAADTFGVSASGILIFTVSGTEVVRGVGIDGDLTVTEDIAGASGAFVNSLTISGVPVATGTGSAGDGGTASALVGADGITVISGVPTPGETTISGFRDEFVSASGSLQDQVDGIGAAGVTSINAVTGVVLVTGTQNVTTQTAAQTITVTGPDLDPYTTDEELVTVSGHLQEQLDTTVSGINDVFALRLDEFNSTVTYVGEADPGSADVANAWRIKKLEETGPDLSITWASGIAAPVFAWTDRLVLSYY